MPAIYTPTSAAAALSITPGAIRKYGELYKRYLSTEATTPPRTYTPDDMRVFAFVAQRTKLGHTHAQVLEDLAAGDAGEFAAFVWMPGEDAPSGEDAAGGLVPVAQYQAVRAMLEDARSLVDAQGEQLRRLERELGRMEAEVSALRRDAGELADRRRKDAEELDALRQAEADRLRREADAHAARPWWARMLGR